MSLKNHYNKRLHFCARKNRNNATLGEALLWKNLLSKSQLGYQFNRQFPFDNYIADFICRKLKLVIEVDGSSHDNKKEQDQKRDEYFRFHGYTVLRISEYEVRSDFMAVTKTVINKVVEIEEKSDRPTKENGAAPPI